MLRQFLLTQAPRRLLATAAAPSSQPLVKVTQHLITPTSANPPEPTASQAAPHQGPSLLTTRGPAAAQVQHFLTPAERHFLFSMVPKAAQSPEWAAHVAAAAKNVVMSDHLAQLTDRTDMHLRQQASKLNQQLENMPAPWAPANPSTDELLQERMDMVRRILSLQSGNNAMVTKWNVQRAMEISRRKHGDTGSPEVQASVLTVRINNLRRHLEASKGKDKHNARGLQVLESKRVKVLKYLKRRNLKSYYETLHKLGL